MDADSNTAESTPTESADAIPTAVIDALLGALNRAGAMLLDTDPDGVRELAQLRGVFRIEITAPPVTLHLRTTERGLAFQRESEETPQVTLRGSCFAFAQLAHRSAFGDSDGDATAGVEVRGDVERGQALQRALRRLDLDWEELLARAIGIGDAPARKIGVALDALARWAEDATDSTRANAADFLREEARLMPTPLAMQTFERDVAQTRAAVDRLARRIERLQTLQRAN